eukprot:jgi/Bigna1/135775/aug1.31_g10483
MSAAQGTKGIVFLMDPEPTGRHARALCERKMGPLFHAFVPSSECTLEKFSFDASKAFQHEAGDVGIEHCKPGSIRAAVQNARLAKPGRKEFSRDDLVSLGLAGVWSITKCNGTRRGFEGMLRKMAASHLGIGGSSPTALVKDLNNYDFSRKELEDAVAWARATPRWKERHVLFPEKEKRRVYS